MNRRPALALMLAYVCLPVGAADPRPTAAPASPRQATLLIDVTAKSFFGVPAGSSEDEVFRTYGRPAGSIRLNERDTLAIYSRNVALVFRNGKLAGLIVSENLLEWEVARQFRAASPFDGTRWHLDNGIRYGSSLAEVRQRLGSRLEGDSFNSSYVEGDLRVHVSFSRVSPDPADEHAHKVRGIRIEPR